MSTEDDRPGRAGDYGSFGRGAETYSTSNFGAGQHGGSSSYFDPDDDLGNEQTTTILPGPSSSPPYDAFAEEPAPRRTAGWHPGADLGLLVLRLVLGVLFVAHGLQVLFGWFQGDGIAGTARLLQGFSYTNTTVLAWVTGIAELVGGTFVTLGLFTPAGAAAILGVMANVLVVKFNGHAFAGNVELESMYAAGAFAILFAGPGRVSLDRPTPWYRHATAFGVTFLLIAAAAAATFLIVFR